MSKEIIKPEYSPSLRLLLIAITELKVKNNAKSLHFRLEVEAMSETGKTGIHLRPSSSAVFFNPSKEEV